MVHIADQLAADFQSCMRNAFPAVAWIRKGETGPIEFAIDKRELLPNDADSIRELIRADAWLRDFPERFAIGEILIGGRPYILVSVAQ
jgi:hypothetical protein